MVSTRRPHHAESLEYLTSIVGTIRSGIGDPNPNSTQHSTPENYYYTKNP